MSRRTPEARPHAKESTANQTPENGSAGGPARRSPLREILTLTAVSLRGMFGANELFHTKERRKLLTRAALGVLYVLLYVMLAVYIVIAAEGLVQIGMAGVIPEILYLMTSLVILFFSIFKAGEIIFELHTYELLISLPVTKSSIVISRFLTMYVTNAALGVLVLTPGLAVYALREQPGALFYVLALVGMLLLPMIPLILATACGALIMAVGSRMRHKSLVISALVLLLVLGFLLSGSVLGGLDESELTMEVLLDVTRLISVWIGRLYPMAVWFNRSLVELDGCAFLLLAGVSLGSFLAVTAAISAAFTQICNALAATTAKHNYRMRTLRTSSVRRALYKRELKRYFASSIYVTNTLISPLMMAAASGTLFFMGWGKLELLLGFTGIPQELFPLLLGMIAALMPTTACSISMEGRQWWITRTLPVTSREVFDSKILVNLTVVLPGYLVSVVFSLLALRPDALGAFWIIALPVIYVLFSSVIGITVNLLFPVFEWENETRVVKQSASVSLILLVDLAVDVPPVLAILFIKGVSVHVILGVTAAVLLMLTGFFYYRNGKRELLDL